MKKFIAILLTIVILGAAVGFVVTRYDFFGDKQTFTIQYKTDEGVKKISVKSGQNYFLEEIPEKTGFEFLGLFDAEVDGVQYVNSSGCSISPFTDNKDLILYPQFEAIEYNFILDYANSQTPGTEKFVTAKFGENIVSFPTNLTNGNDMYAFAGWYIEGGNGSVQVADARGSLVYPTLGKEIIAYSDENNYIQVYAKFELKSVDTRTYTLVFDFGECDMYKAPEKVKYGEYIPTLPGDLVIADKSKTFSGWFTSSDGNGIQVADKNGNPLTRLNADIANLSNEFGEITLYALFGIKMVDVKFVMNPNDYYSIETVSVPVGSDLSTIATGKKYGDLYIISWSKDEQGTQIFSGKIYEDMTLYPAQMGRKISFNTNGGKPIEPLILPVGADLTLPIPSKAGYKFLCWKKDNQEFKLTKMPDYDIELTANYSGISGVFEDKNAKRIKKHNANKNPSDYFTISSKTGYTVEQLRQFGYKNVKFKLTISMYEQDDAYQEIYVCKSPYQDENFYNRIWGVNKHEHTPGKLDKQTKTYTYTFEAKLSEIRNEIYIYYGSNGGSFLYDGIWFRTYIKLEFAFE